MNLSHEDMCRLSRLFNERADLSGQQDYRINEWLKEQIAKAYSPAPVSRPQAGEDVVERFTPNEIIMLLHFYCSAAPFDRIHAPACQAAVQRFLAAGWIEPSNKSGNQYHTTAAGTVMVNAICRITSTDRERGLEEAK